MLRFIESKSHCKKNRHGIYTSSFFLKASFVFFSFKYKNNFSFSQNFLRFSVLGKRESFLYSCARRSFSFVFGTDEIRVLSPLITLDIVEKLKRHIYNLSFTSTFKLVFFDHYFHFVFKICLLEKITWLFVLFRFIPHRVRSGTD